MEQGRSRGSKVRVLASGEKGEVPSSMWVLASGEKGEEPSRMWEPLMAWELVKQQKLRFLKRVDWGVCSERGSTACARLCLSVSELGPSTSGAQASHGPLGDELEACYSCALTSVLRPGQS